MGGREMQHHWREHNVAFIAVLRDPLPSPPHRGEGADPEAIHHAALSQASA